MAAATIADEPASDAAAAACGRALASPWLAGAPAADHPAPLRRALRARESRCEHAAAAARRGRAEPPIADVLGGAPWLPLLASGLSERLLAGAYLTWHEPRHPVAHRGEPVHSWVGVARGQVAVCRVLHSGRAVRFADVAAGGWTDDVPVMPAARRPNDIVAIRRTLAVHVPAELFGWLLQSSPAFNHYIIRQLAERVQHLTATVEADRCSDPVTRLARAIVGLCHPVLNPGMGARLDLSQEDLGELAGLTRQRTNLAAKTLERRGVLTVCYGGLLVNDLEALRRAADG